MIEFKDTKYMSSKEKVRAYKTFKRVIETRDISNMDNNLYEHLKNHSGFIAHYSRHGFIEEYSGRRFLGFLRNILQQGSMFAWGDYWDVNSEMLKIVHQHAEKIIEEFNNEKMNKEIEFMKELAAKYGYDVIRKDANALELDTEIDESGQISLLV